MVQYPVRGGIDSFGIYKEEVTYNTDPGTWGTGAQSIGMVQSITPSLSRNLIKLRGINGCLPTVNTTATSRDAQQIVAGKFDVGLDIDFQPQNFTFLKYVFGSVSGSDPYEYPQASASTTADKKKYLKLPSISVATRYDFGGSGDAVDKTWIFTGLKVNTWNIKAAMGEPISCSLNLLGANIKGDETTVETSYPCVALSTEDVYTFAGASVTYGGSEIPNIIDGVDLTVNNTVEILAGLGDYTGKAGISKQRDFTVKFDLTAEGKTFMDDFIGSATDVAVPTEISTVELIFSNSASIDLTVTLKNLKIADDGLPINYGEVSKESITLEAEFGYAVENQS